MKDSIRICSSSFNRFSLIFRPQSPAHPTTWRPVFTVITTWGPCRGRPVPAQWATRPVSLGVMVTLCPATPTKHSVTLKISTVESSTTPASSPSERHSTAVPPPPFCWSQVWYLQLWPQFIKILTSVQLLLTFPSVCSSLCS